MAERVQIVLWASQGQSTGQIAVALRTRPARVSKWRQRFAQHRVEGLHDGSRSGKPRRHDSSTEKRVLKHLDQPPPAGHSTWTGHLLAQALSDVSEDQVWRVLRREGISLRRRREFRDFMNEVVADHLDSELHVVLDNLNTQKPKTDGWLRRHPRVHFHDTPTYASWLNQVECWFSILSRQTLHRPGFTSPQELRKAIDRFVTVYNQTASPFEWRKAVVHPATPKRHYAS